MMIQPRTFIYQSTAISKQQFDAHMKLYHNYVDMVNKITNNILTNPDYEGANSLCSRFRELKKGETFTISAVSLHEAYFQNMTDRPLEPGPLATELFQRYFEGYEKWSRAFVACGRAARGWSVLAFEQRSGRFFNMLLDSHDEGTIIGAYPLLVMDVYEHAYFLDYGVEKNKYIDAFLACVDWDVVEKRLEKVL